MGRPSVLAVLLLARYTLQYSCCGATPVTLTSRFYGRRLHTRMVPGAKLATLGLLVLSGVAAVPRDSSSPKLYVCQDGQCVLNDKGLPLSECEVACIPPPSANYTCQGGQCVINSRGLPKAELSATWSVVARARRRRQHHQRSRISCS